MPEHAALRTRRIVGIELNRIARQLELDRRTGPNRQTEIEFNHRLDIIYVYIYIYIYIYV